MVIGKIFGEGGTGTGSKMWGFHKKKLYDQSKEVEESEGCVEEKIGWLRQANFLENTNTSDPTLSPYFLISVRV